MRVFVFEFVSGGGLADAPLPPSLAAEGRAMWSAVARDFSAIADARVVTTRDPRIAPLPHGIEQRVAESVASERDLFREECAAADVILVIAPELGGELQRRIERADALRRPDSVLLNCPPAVVRIAADKWLTFETLDQRGIPTISTHRLSNDVPPFPLPWVVKPRLGAGSQDVALVQSLDRLGGALTEAPGLAEPDAAIIQPFVAGRSLSCLALFDAAGALVDLAPVAEQRLSDDGRFRYLGGRIPADVDPAPLQALALSAAAALSAGAQAPCVGPIGFDFVQAADGTLQVVDINPRLTTSYVGCRRLATHNLFASLLALEAGPRGWGREPVEFSVADLAAAL
ncbi:MAG: ATP-grasp domain-containing protein [Planctomyces sp.]|nr:ATP-grasp domain-containing protein [Planctomyces sp.]